MKLNYSYNRVPWKNNTMEKLSEILSIKFFFKMQGQHISYTYTSVLSERNFIWFMTSLGGCWHTIIRKYIIFKKMNLCLFFAHWLYIFYKKIIFPFNYFCFCVPWACGVILKKVHTMSRRMFFIYSLLEVL